jgi:hypothetical protein
VIVVAAVARPKPATSLAGRAAAELEERVKEKVVQDLRVAEYGGAIKYHVSRS